MATQRSKQRTAAGEKGGSVEHKEEGEVEGGKGRGGREKREQHGTSMGVDQE